MSCNANLDWIGAFPTFHIGGVGTWGLAPAAPIPEPATWAMILVGFGMIGATARYRRKGAQVRYA
ncbi:PEPxxWA-CTERM sorting domain-containing protein [Sphingomonas sp. Leaf339]|uniref:PEPxxWA-CTERM sorting domain-containing protein n=1 Tax=Sphingomonas sp. Leaf339 TaxID=1736343 RepID=UPI0009E9EE65